MLDSIFYSVEVTTEILYRSEILHESTLVRAARALVLQLQIFDIMAFLLCEEAKQSKEDMNNILV